MPSADQIKSLIASLAEGDEAHFYSIAMQIAASEARIGHGKLAEEIRSLIDKAKSRVGPSSKNPILLARPRGELAELLNVSYPNVRLSNMILSVSTKRKLERVIREQRAIQIIRSRGLSPRRKLLLIGKPGTGKTLLPQPSQESLAYLFSLFVSIASSLNSWAKQPLNFV